MQNVLRAATLAVAALTLGACSSNPAQVVWLTAADPAEIELGLAPPQRRPVSGGPSRRKSVPRTVAHKTTYPDLPAKKLEPEMTGSAGPTPGPAAAERSEAEREEQKRQAQIANEKRMDELNSSGKRATLGICIRC